MKTVRSRRREMRDPAGIGGRLRAAAGGLSLIAGLTGFVAGCGGGPAAPVHAPARPAVPGPERAYVVGKGDTLYSIAWRHGFDYRTLARVNSVGDPYTIYPGQRLLLPEPDEAVPPEPEPEPEREADADGTSVSGAPSIRGAGTTPTPVVTPLPPSLPTPGPSSEPSRQAPAKPQQPVPTAAVVEAPPKALPEAPVPGQEPAPKVPKPAEQAPLAARTVAGLQWTRPAGGKTISTFGRGGNKGIDIEGAFEQPIRAAAPGRVVYAGSGLIGYGKLVIVKHSTRLLSAYAHNERLHVGEGDAVQGGQHIADMGRSGKGRVMLHFEIRRDGKPVDPLRFLP